MKKYLIYGAVLPLCLIAAFALGIVGSSTASAATTHAHHIASDGNGFSFGGNVASVDLDTNTFTTIFGTVYTVDENTTYSGSLTSLDDLQAGDIVAAVGIVQDDGTRLVTQISR